jgi:hypothetical protein
MAQINENIIVTGLAAGQVTNGLSILKDALTGAILDSKAFTKVAVVTTGTSVAAAWRRRYRRYCHWLIHQYDNYTANAGVFAVPGFSPVPSGGEAVSLAAVKTALYALGYRYGTPTSSLPMTPP